MTTGGDHRGGPGAPGSDEPQRTRLSTCFVLVGLYWLLLVAGSYLLGRLEPGILSRSWVAQGIALAVIAVVVAVLWEARRRLLRIVTSLPFSVALIAFVLVATAIGTVVLQGAPADAYRERHGHALGSVVLALGMNDLFHTPWFQGLLALMAASLVLTVIARRAWRPPMWGHLLSHLGFVTVLVGGWYGGYFGFKGVIDLHEGQEVQHVRIPGKGGPHGESRSLGFGLRLERFVVETYASVAKFYVYERNGEEYRPVRAFDLKELAKDQPVGSSGATFRLVQAYPDFFLEPDVRDAPPGQGTPVLRLELKEEDRAVPLALVAGVPGRDTTVVPGDGPTAVRFVWPTPSDADVAGFTEAAPEAHIISFHPEEGDAEEVAVTVGTNAVLPRSGYEVRVLEYLPDFTYDSATKRAATRSQTPNNPAVRVAIVDPETRQEQVRWLFAKMPDFGHGDGAPSGPRFIYRHLPSRRPAPRELLVLGDARQIWRLEHGKVLQRLPLDQWRDVTGELPVQDLRVHASGIIATVPGSRSQAWTNPMADIVLQDGGAAREMRVAAAHGRPIALSDGRTFLSFELRANEPKSFRSRLTVLENGTPVTEKTIAVNDPLSYKGYMFYQSNFRKDDPTYSGIQVVKDPGLAIAFIGFIMISVGVIFVYYVRPRLLARETTGASHGH